MVMRNWNVFVILLLRWILPHRGIALLRFFFIDLDDKALISFTVLVLTEVSQSLI